MEVIKKSTSLVITGAWNPAIINPEWIAKELFKRNAADPIPLEIEFGPGIGISPRFTLEHLTFVPGQEKVVIIVPEVESDLLNTAEKKAIQLLQTLPHTPISGFGENFEFNEDAPSKAHLEVFNQTDDLAERLKFKYKVTSTSTHHALQVEDHVINIRRTLSDGKFRIAFNFHYPRTSADQAAASLENTFAANFGNACQIIESLYGDKMTIQKEVANV